MKTKEITSKENIKYSLIFILLSIVFWEMYFRLTIQLTIEMRKNIPSPPTFISIFGSLNGILLSFIWIIGGVTPYIVFIYRRKYETFLLGFLIPSIITYVYTFSTFGVSLISQPMILWSFWYLLPAFILIYLLKRSKSFKGEIFGITFFCILNSVFDIFLPLIATLERMWAGPPFSFSLEMISIYIVQGFFAVLYLIILSFFIEKVLKVEMIKCQT